MTHTPGPWEMARAGNYDKGQFDLKEYFVRRPEDDVAIASDIMDPENAEPSKSNALLISAAPDLLYAAKRTLWFLNDIYKTDIFCDDSETLGKLIKSIQDLEAATKKAEGRE